MISVENLTKSYGKQILFEGLTFKINSRERVGVVGRNGHGKTTLFRLVAGDEHPDAGTIAIPKQYRIGYVRQEIDFIEDTVLKEGLRGLAEEQRHEHWKVEKILAGLGFSPADMRRHPLEFSGGFQVRLNLAKVLVAEPDLLLLDEPTNFLDITSIRWTERFLIAWPRELMLITHDRSFMDKIVTHTMGIHRQRMRKIAGNTEKYYAQIAQDEEVYEKTRSNDERRRKEIEQFITRFRAKARLASLVQSRVKLLSKMEPQEKLSTIKTLDFSFQSKPFEARHILQVREVSFGYEPAVPLIKKLNMTIGRRDRVCVVGKNGKGKTTLLKLLAGLLRPQHGQVTYNPKAVKGLFEQSAISNLDDARTVEEEIFLAHPQVDRQLARDICGAMMFEGDAVLKKIAVISGGEKSRVMLGKLLVTPVNLLLLDEPTNHLDMDSCDALLAALDSFEGALVMVTHNEMFLDALAERLIVFQGDRPYVFEGSYQRFLEQEGWAEEEPPRRLLAEKQPAHEGSKKLNKKELRKRRSEIIVERGKALNPVEQRIARVEQDIESHEAGLQQCLADMQAASQAREGVRIAALSQTMREHQKAVDQLFAELEELTDRRHELKSSFDQRLLDIEAQENS